MEVWSQGQEDLLVFQEATSRHGNSLQYSCLENPMDRGALRARVHGAAKSQTWTATTIITRTCYLPPTVSVQFSCSVVSDSLRPHELQHARPSCPSPTPRVHPNPCSSSQWCYLTISSSLVPFSSCPQSFPASGSFPMSQLFPSGGRSIGVSVLISVLPMNTQGWSPLGWTGWNSLQSKGLSRVISNTTVQKHRFFCIQLSL